MIAYCKCPVNGKGRQWRRYHATAHAYDRYGNLTSTTEGATNASAVVWGTTHWGSPADWGAAPLNLTTTFTPDSWGNITAVTDPLSHVSNATFDLDRRKLLEIEPYPGSGTRTATNTIYDGNGRVTEVDKGTTNSGTTFTALETTTTAFGPTAKTQVSVLNGPFGSAALTVTQMSYDALNRVICTAVRENSSAFGRSPAPAPSRPARSPTRSLRSPMTWPARNIPRRAGWEARSPRSTGPGPTVSTASWPPCSTATTTLPPTSMTASIALAKLEYPMPTLGSGVSDPSDAEAFTLYDANSNLKSKTKRDGTTIINFTYDVLNRRTAKTFPATTSANVSYAYDAAGRPLNALFANIGGTPGITWTYDAAGRRITEATNGRSLSFAYDNDSNPHTLTWPDAASVTFAYDTADRFGSVSNSAFSVGAGYDTLSRVNGLTRPSSSSTSVTIRPTAMTSLAHAFTPTTGNETWTYAFTPASQLATTTGTNSAWDWSASSASAVNTVADGLNRNATVAGVTQTYDHFGNLTSDGTRTFTYDTENRLLTESGPVTLALSYDPLGRLQQSVISGNTIQFLYDSDALVGEYAASGNTPLRRYVHGPGVDDPVIWYEGTTMTASNANYLIADRQGSVVATANTSGALAVNYTYDAYGAPNAWGSIGSTPRFRYTGQASIPEAQLYYYKARVYDPVAGKFLQTDPVGYGPDVNWYLYVRDDPVNGDDPGGMTGDCTGSNIDCGGGLATGASGTVTLGAGHDLPTLAERQASVSQPGLQPSSSNSGVRQFAMAEGGEPEEKERGFIEEMIDPAADIRAEIYSEHLAALRQISPGAAFIGPSGPPSETAVRVVEEQLAETRGNIADAIVTKSFGRGGFPGLSASEFRDLAVEIMTRSPGKAISSGPPGRVIFFSSEARTAVIVNTTRLDRSTMFRSNQPYVNRITSP